MSSRSTQQVVSNIGQNVSRHHVLLGFISLVSLLITALPLFFLPTHPWNGDALYNEIPLLLEFQQGTIFDLPRDFVLVVTTVFVSWLFGISAKTALATLPLFLFATGVYAYGLLSTKYLNDPLAGLWAALIFGTYGPTVYWVASTVRESFALALLPWLLLALWYYLTEPSPITWLIFTGSVFVIIMTHHWSTLMLLVGITPLLLVGALNKEEWRSRMLYAEALIFGSFYVYWIYAVDWLSGLVQKGIGILTDEGNGDGTSSGGSEGGGAGESGGGILEMIGDIFVFSRPPQMFGTLLLVTSLAALGVFIAVYRREKRVTIMTLSVGSLSVLLGVGIMLGGNFIVFDPLRVLEFLAFPAGIAAGYGIAEMSREVEGDIAGLASVVLVIMLVVFAITFYPIPYYTGTQVDVNHPGYDIRGDKFFITSQDIEALEFADQYELQVNSPGVNTVTLHGEIIYQLGGRCTFWVSSSVDRTIEAQQTQDVAEELRTDETLVQETKNSQDIIYSNNRGELYPMPDNQYCTV